VLSAPGLYGRVSHFDNRHFARWPALNTLLPRVVYGAPVPTAAYATSITAAYSSACADKDTGWKQQQQQQQQPPCDRCSGRGRVGSVGSASTATAPLSLSSSLSLDASGAGDA
jgi:hypothetical protein